MSKCIKCGRELTSAEIPEFYNGMCEKCCKELNCAEYPFKQGINDYQNQIDQLKQQLAEKDIRIEELECQFAYECECNMQLVDLQKQLEEKQKTIDEINKEFVQAIHDWKTLCAEKDKEIKRLKNLFKLNNEVVINQGKEIFDLRVQVLQQKQNQTQLAIQELEKVNGILTDTIIEITQDEFDLNKLCYLEEISAKFYEKIQQQIKELKGE